MCWYTWTRKDWEWAVSVLSEVKRLSGDEADRTVVRRSLIVQTGEMSWWQRMQANQKMAVWKKNGRLGMRTTSKRGEGVQVEKTKKVTVWRECPFSRTRGYEC
jgi:hypothetical protein